MRRIICSHSCIDARENGLSEQHGLPTMNGIYMSREGGVYVSKPDAYVDATTTTVLLVQLDIAPISFFQGHRGCAAVQNIFRCYGKDIASLTNTQRRALRSYGDALEIAKKATKGFPLHKQQRLFEKLCVGASINNEFAHKEAGNKRGYTPLMYGHYSLTPLLSEGPVIEPKNIGLLILDPRRNVFVHSGQSQSNDGVCIPDLVDVNRARLLYDEDPFRIEDPLDLEAIAYNEAKLISAGKRPGQEEKTFRPPSRHPLLDRRKKPDGPH